MDVEEVMLDFNGTLDFPQGLLLTAFCILQGSEWLWAGISGFRLFSPSSLLWSSYYLSLYKNMTKRIVHSPYGLSGVWLYYRADNLPSTSVTLFCSCMFPASFCWCCLSASKMLPHLVNLTDFNLFFGTLYGYPHLCETCPDIPLPILS